MNWTNNVGARNQPRLKQSLNYRFCFLSTSCCNYYDNVRIPQTLHLQYETLLKAKVASAKKFLLKNVLNLENNVGRMGKLLNRNARLIANSNLTDNSTDHCLEAIRLFVIV
jgi:hypothetical protein